MSLAIQLRGVTKSFGALRVLHGIDLDVRAGEKLALLGPSGCGKTTLLRLIAGLERGDAGVVSVAGQVVCDRDVYVPPERRRVGLVFQDYALFPHLDAAANTAFGLRSVDSAVIDELLERVGLGGLGGRYPHELSGGQQQRLALARALAPNPRVLLLDEPFSNLDAHLRARMRNEVTGIIDQFDTTAILVTHDQQEAMAFADRVAILLGGHLAQVDTPRAIYHHPASLDVARFVGGGSLLSGKAQGGRVHTWLGTLTGEGPDTQDALVVIRPSQLVIDGDGTATTVASVDYFGDEQLVSLRAEGAGREVSARLDGSVVLDVGDRVKVAVRGAVSWFNRT